MIQNMPKASITIPAGGMYQEWSCLMDLVKEDTAKTLEQLAERVRLLQKELRPPNATNTVISSKSNSY